MKKIILSAIVTFGLATFVSAQNVKFFVSKSASIGLECDCKATTSIKVVFPVPSNVGTFDSYEFYLNLSSLDVPATIGFDKNEIAAKLVGKKEFSAYLLLEDGGSDFYFEDVYLEKKDLCANPRMWGITDLQIDGVGVGYKIIGYHYEDTWNDYYSRWDSKKFEDWDEGIAHGEGSITMTQAPLSYGFTDLYDIITIKAANTDSASFSVSEDIAMNGAISIVDKSQEFTTNIYYATWAGGDATYNEFKEEVQASITGQLQVGPVHEFYFLRNMQEGREVVVPGKTDSYSKVTFNGIPYETISHCRTESDSNTDYEQGFYSTFYIYRSGEYTSVIVSITSEEFTLKSKGSSLTDGSEKIYSVKMNEETIKKIDEINAKWLNATAYNLPQ